MESGMPERKEKEAQSAVQHAAPHVAKEKYTVVEVELGPETDVVTCPSCHERVQTKVKVRPSLWTHFLAALICIVGCCFCSLGPYCIDQCQAKHHYCPNCGVLLGTYDKF